jgi:hypothetical protein
MLVTGLAVFTGAVLVGGLALGLFGATIGVAFVAGQLLAAR